MKLTNQKIQILVSGFKSMIYDKDGNQRDLPMLPSVRMKRMLKDLEPLQEPISEARKEKEDKVSDLSDELEERVSDDEDDYSADDMREELNSFIEDQNEEMEDLLEQEVEVDFSDPLKEDDVERIDESNIGFPYVSSSAMEIVLTEIVDESE